MKIYLLNSQIPELCQLSRRRRNVLAKAANRHDQTRKYIWPMAGICLICAIPLGNAIAALNPIVKQSLTGTAINGKVVDFALSVIPGVVVGLIALQFGITRWRTVLRNRMRNRHGKPYVCFGCGYPLRSIAGPICPECGAKIVIAPRDRSREGCLERSTSARMLN